MPRRSDIWRIGIAQAPFEEITASGSLAEVPIHWLDPGPRFTFRADPFGLWRDGELHLFVEAYDYRSRHGVIEHIALDAVFRPVSRATVLAEPWHLSFPQLIESEGELWMLPEACRSGRLTLYRCTRFPDRWEAAETIALDVVAIDATPLLHENRWWLFYSPAGDRIRAQSHLHVAWADRLAGPWHPHPGNPVRIDRASARPGGTARTIDGLPVLPVQDCERTYGGAIRLLWMTALTPDTFSAEASSAIPPPRSAAPFLDGLHTLSACGFVTLIDAKRIDRSPQGLLIDLGRRLRSLGTAR